jgi:transcriptional regulator with XRE-family HTH domain
MNGSLGAFLKKTRKQRSLTLRAVQKETGISNAYLSQLENNKIANPSPNILNQLAKLYETSYDNLMSLAGYPALEDTRPSFRVQSDFNELTTEEKESVREYIQFLKSRRKVE